MAKKKSPPWCSATFPLDPHAPPSAPSRDSLYQAISLHLGARSMRIQGRQCAPSLCCHILLKGPPSLGYQDSQQVFPGTGSVSPQDTIPRFVPHFTQRCLRPHFSSDPGSGLMSILEQALGTGRVPAGPPQVLPAQVGRCLFSAEGETALPLSSQQLKIVPPGLKPQDHLGISCPSHRLLVNFQMSTHPWPLSSSQHHPPVWARLTKTSFFHCEPLFTLQFWSHSYQKPSSPLPSCPPGPPC